MKQPAYTTVIQQLRVWQTDVVQRLRQRPHDVEAFSRKQEIDSAIRSLEFCAKHQITPTMQVYCLPAIEATYGEFRLLWDYETEDRTVWQEAQVSDQPLRALPGDLLLSRGRDA
jgi:hypothetical protein